MQHRAGQVFHALHQFHQEVVVGGAHGCETNAAVAGHHRGHTVIRRRLQPVVPGGLAVVVGVNVDEAGRHQRTIGIEFACAAAADIADFHDHAVTDGHVGRALRCACAVDDAAAADDDVEFHPEPPGATVCDGDRGRLAELRQA